MQGVGCSLDTCDVQQSLKAAVEWWHASGVVVTCCLVSMVQAALWQCSSVWVMLLLWQQSLNNPVLPASFQLLRPSQSQVNW
jgi:hypothetical protein